VSFPHPTGHDDPLALLAAWYEAAERQGVQLPDAAALATVAPDGQPSVRMVLYKGMLGGRLRFFTNYESRKARELDREPRCALVFHWKEVARQVRVEGVAVRTPRAESEAYFASRPRDSQLAAIVSAQSQPVESYSALVEQYERAAHVLATDPLECPSGWGGYALEPSLVEFWIGHDARLHERQVFTREGGLAWVRRCLAP
jgi:pyridoxamine 5'-phosphate oxidase